MFSPASLLLIFYAFVWTAEDPLAGQKLPLDCELDTIVYHFPDGSVYEGQYCTGPEPESTNSEEMRVDSSEYLLERLQGQGSMRYSNGNVYQGTWEEGKPHGMGIMAFASGVVYDGAWNRGKMTGNGVLTSPSGNVYTGEFLNGRYHGRGRLE